jgi:hypothetical protein
MGAFLVGYPRTRIKIAYFFWLGFQPRWGSWLVPAWLVLPLWLVVELASALAAPPDAGVAYWAHVGGFACGGLVALVARRMRLVASDGGHEIVRGTGAAPPPERPLGAPIHNLGQGPRQKSIRPGDGPLPVRDVEIGEIPAAREDDRIER